MHPKSFCRGVAFEALEPRAFLSAVTELAPLASTPDLTVTFVTNTLPDTALLPGQSGSVSVIVHNNGAATAAGKINLRLYLSTDNTLDTAVDKLGGQTLSQSIRLAPGAASKPIKIAGLLSATLAPGAYFLLAQVDAANAIAESDETNNVTASPAAAQVVWKFGSFDADHRNSKLTIQESDGTLVTFALAGPGYGVLTPGSGLTNVDLRNTTAASSVTITTKKSTIAGDNGFFSMGNLTVGDLGDAAVTGIKQITAATSYLLGQAIVEGPLGGMSLGPVASTLVDLRGTGGAPMTLNFGRVINLDFFHAASPIKSLTATEWLDYDNFSHPNRFEAPSVATMNIKGDPKVTTTLVRGDLDTDMILTAPGVSLGKLTVNGTIHEMSIRATGDIASVTAGRLYFADIYAGVNTGVTGLPTSASDFLSGSNAKIGTVTVKGLKITDTSTFYAFTSSDIAAPRLGKITLARIWQDFGSRPFGIAANTIDSLKITQDGKTYAWGAADWNSYNWNFFHVNDFV